MIAGAAVPSVGKITNSLITVLQILAIEPLVGKVGEVDALPINEVRAATILVNHGPCIVARWRNIADCSIRLALHNHIAPLLQWSSFHPIDVLTVGLQIAERNTSLGQ
jgi:hypothetical protein